MWTSYETKDPYKDIAYSKTKNRAAIKTTSSNAQIDQTLSESNVSLDIDIELILDQLKDILKSPSPLTLYKKSNELKENFSAFINYIAKKLAEWFNSQNKTVILSMYQNAGYQQIWINNLKNYLEDSKYFDLNLYFKAVTVFNKEKQYLAKWILKMYSWSSKDQIDSFLHKYKSKYKFEDIKGIFDSLRIKDAKIETKYLDENKVERFLEQLFLAGNIDSDKLLWHFWINIEEMKSKFDDTYSIFSDITRSYLKNVSLRDKEIIEFINFEKNSLVKEELDSEIKKYFENKEDFYKCVVNILSEKNTVERWYFWSYVKTEIINRHYKEITRLFYWNKQACSNRNEWSTLKWNFLLNEKNTFRNEINWILSFKTLILNLNNSMLSPFLKPMVYDIVSEKINISQKDLLKLRYLMTLILSENYTEYKKIYNFFEDLETFLDFNMCKLNFIYVNFKKLKIYASLIIVASMVLSFLYVYAPVWVFVSVILLLLSYFRSHFWAFHAGIEWNFWTKTFATILLAISWFFWITNLNKTKIDLNDLTQKAEKLWTYKTEEAVIIVSAKIWNLKIWEMVADILQTKK